MENGDARLETLRRDGGGRGDAERAACADRGRAWAAAGDADIVRGHGCGKRYEIGGGAATSAAFECDDLRGWIVDHDGAIERAAEGHYSPYNSAGYVWTAGAAGRPANTGHTSGRIWQRKFVGAGGVGSATREEQDYRSRAGAGGDGHRRRAPVNVQKAVAGASGR